MRGKPLLIAALLFFGIPLGTCVTMTALVVATWDSGHHAKVPHDAIPTGFKEFARWQSCGADGEYCGETVLIGGSESFESAAGKIEARYRDKGYSVDT